VICLSLNGRTSVRQILIFRSEAFPSAGDKDGSVPKRCWYGCLLGTRFRLLWLSHEREGHRSRMARPGNKARLIVSSPPRLLGLGHGGRRAQVFGINRWMTASASLQFAAFRNHIQLAEYPSENWRRLVTGVRFIAQRPISGRVRHPRSQLRIDRRTC
jgi:hypothetical protein